MLYKSTVPLRGSSENLSDWRTNKKTWAEKIEYMYKSNHGCDISVKIWFKAHRFILGASSEVLESVMKTEVFKIPGEATIVFTNINPDSFKIFLDFIYTGEGAPSTSQQAIELHRIADKLWVPELKEVSSAYIEDKVNASNVMETYVFADVYKKDELKRRCIEIIQNETKEVINDVNVTNFSPQFLVVILDQPALSIKECELFRLVVKWFSSYRETDVCAKACVHNPTDDMNKRLEHCLMSRFRFMSMSADEFLEGPMRAGMLSKKDELAILGHIASKTCKLPYPVCFNRNPRTNLEDNKKKKENNQNIEVREVTPDTTSPVDPSDKGETDGKRLRKSKSSVVIREPEQQKQDKSQNSDSDKDDNSEESFHAKSQKTDSVYRVDKDGSTPPPTIGVQQVSSVVPGYLNQIVSERTKPTKPRRSKRTSATSNKNASNK
ncbi:uncharacterized protein LOC106669554 isoform X2 [Cimex lectularius]|uniref:BTB domain-containing protein n=1 Tax=Cimex lectularius TaxID=79782 RepID=A0A8I6S251_CIMLE|nr:uncharacterized protein LOC106669554 isoform X2 [Cimex lectularius]